MKKKLKIFGLAALLLAPVIAYAANQTRLGYDKVEIGNSTAVDKDLRLNVGLGASNPGIRGNASTGKTQFWDGSQFKDIGSGSGGGGGGVVLNTNGGFEDGLSAWTASGGVTAVITAAANVGFGAQSASWDASAASQTFSNDAVTVPAGLFGKVCTLSWYYKGGDANLKAQVYDGTNVIAESSALSAQTDYSAKQVIYFTCPSSGTIQARFIASADAALVYLDDIKLGQDTFFNASTAQFEGKLTLPATANCEWQANGITSFTNFSADSDCSATPTTSGNLAYFGSKVPGFQLLNVVAGKRYLIKYSGNTFVNSGNGCAFRLSNGTDVSETVVSGNGSLGNQSDSSLSFDMVFSTSGTQSVQIQAAQGGAGSSNCWIPGGTNNFNNTFSVFSFPDVGTGAISIDKAGWRIDANIGGAQASLTTGTITSYSEITDAALDMVLASGSASAEIPCSGTNPSSGLTCSAGSESVGVAFTPPTAGLYEVCFRFSHEVTGATQDVAANFELYETPNNAQTNLARGGQRSPGRIAMSSAVGGTDIPHNVCGQFTFSDTSKRTIRLKYVQNFSAGLGSVLMIDRNAGSGGDRDLRLSVRRKIEFSDAVKFTNLVTTNLQTGLKINVAQINMANSTTCTLGSQLGSWINAVAYAGSAGDCTITLENIYSSPPYCFATGTGFLAAPNTTRIPHVQSVSNTSLTVRQRNSAASGDDGNYNLTCIGM